FQIGFSHNTYAAGLVAYVKKRNLIAFFPQIVTGIKRGHFLTVKAKSLGNCVVKIFKRSICLNFNVAENVFVGVENYSETVDHFCKIRVQSYKLLRGLWV